MRSQADTEAQRVLTAADARPPRERLILRLLLDYELTASEICRLLTDDADRDALRVLDKRGRARTVTLRPETAADLAHLAAAGAGEQLLAGRFGHLRPEAIKRLLSTVAVDAGVVDPQLSIHRRHRCVNTQA